MLLRLGLGGIGGGNINPRPSSFLNLVFPNATDFVSVIELMSSSVLLDFFSFAAEV
jgi:hypothetical protein